MTDINSKKIREYALKSRGKIIIKPFYNSTYDQICFCGLSFKMLERLIQTQALTDYYRYIKCDDLIDQTNNLTFFPKSNSDDDILELFENVDLSNKMYDALVEYSEASAYDKILLEKSLDSDDMDRLKKLNPFFEEEHNKYNVEVDLDLIKRQLSKWQNCFKDDPDESYEVTSTFLISLYKINKIECLKVVEELLNSLDKNIYIHNNHAQDNSIILKGMIIDKDILTQILKDFDEKSKAKKYTYDN